jgi:hypothetical protein
MNAKRVIIMMRNRITLKTSIVCLQPKKFTILSNGSVAKRPPEYPRKSAIPSIKEKKSRPKSSSVFFTIPRYATLAPKPTRTLEKKRKNTECAKEKRKEPTHSKKPPVTKILFVPK